MIDTPSAVRVAYFVRIPNVGDLLNVDVVGALTGRDVIHSGLDRPHLLGIGSLMSWATSDSTVWGTGLLNAGMGFGGVEGTNVRALRGKLTYAELRRGGVPLRDVPLGDPGVFAPSVLGIVPSTDPTFRIGLVCHHTDRYHPVLRRMMAEEGVADLNVHDEPTRFLRRMAECETVLSTSLHGLVLAEALGIPNLWIRGYGESVVGDFKFQDWFSTTARPQLHAHVVRETDLASGLYALAELHDCQIDLDAVRNAFPDPVGCEKPEALVSTASCRSRPMPAFLLGFRNGDALMREVAALRAQSHPIQPVIVTCGSDDSETLSAVADLRSQGIDVIAAGDEAACYDLFTAFRSAVGMFFATWAEPSRYIVSDGRIDSSGLHRDHVAICNELLNKLRTIECGGAATSLERETLRPASFESTSFGQIATEQRSFDLEFAVHRAGESVRRGKAGLGVWSSALG